MVSPTGMGSAPSCLHSRRGAICHRSIHRVYYNSRKPEEVTESEASGCIVLHSAPVPCNVQSLWYYSLANAPCLCRFHFNAYLGSHNVLVISETEWMVTHILTVKSLSVIRPAPSWNRSKPASQKIIFQYKSDLE